MGKSRQTRKERKYLKAGDLVETVNYLYGSLVDGMPAIPYRDHFPDLGEIGLILSVKRRTKRDSASSCVILFRERKFRFDGVYWKSFKRIEQKF